VSVFVSSIVKVQFVCMGLRTGVAMFSEVARCVDGGGREPGCWRILLSPDAPMPCSYSGMIGLLYTCQSFLPLPTLLRSFFMPCPVQSVRANSPRHAVQLPGIDAHALRRVYGRRRPLGEQVGRALVLDQRGIVVGACRRGIEVGFFWWRAWRRGRVSSGHCERVCQGTFGGCTW